MSYPEGSVGAATDVPDARRRRPQVLALAVLRCRGQRKRRRLRLTYGTSKPEFWFNPFEASAALAVRGWFAAWKAGDPLLLGAFVDQQVIFRA